MLILTFLLATAFPSNSKTSWMTPESFGLTVGMTRSDAMKTLVDGGWSTKAGPDGNQLVVDYSNDKSLTLDFTGERLKSIRFELFAFLPEARTAFTEQKTFLRSRLGTPKALPSKSIVLYDGTLPNVMLVLSDDPKSVNGRKGLGVVVVRYFDPLR